MAIPVRTAVLALSLSAAVAAPAPSQAADILGTWLTKGGKSHVTIEPCGERFCGKIVWMKEPNDAAGKPKLDKENSDEALRSRPILGLPLLTGFKKNGAREWDGGQIYNPEDGKTYRSELELKSDHELGVSGCVLFFCKEQLWTRVP
ncbi:MAG: DUF2147 domain-containing protein [Hyphomicrobiales bacterium]|nr:DUF2147 domain-containing protein [Hyphomicrobiales bacterium]MCP5372821.1 DUF2147 domain-containing protein [Hyphomicrobiales bacterium]